MEAILKEKWPLILRKLQTNCKMTDISYKTWLRPIEIDLYVEGVLFLAVPRMQMVGSEFIRKKFAQPLQEAVKEIAGIECEIIFVNPPEEERFTLKSFSVKPSNFEAFIVAGALAKGYYQKKSHVLLCGPKESGKTHLLKAIKHEICKNGVDKKIHYVTGQDFFSELMWDITHGTCQYIEKYEKEYDILLVDDIDYIPKSQVVQEEILRLLKLMEEDDRQVVVTSNKALDEMDNLIEELFQFIKNGERIKIKNLIFQ